MKDSTNLDYANQLLSETREEVGRADTKAAILLSASGIIVSVLVATDWTNSSSVRTLPPWSQDVLVGAAVLLGLGIFLLGLAVLPRSVSARAVQRPPYFFGEVADYKDDETRLLKDLESASNHTLQRTSNQLLIISKIVLRKYRYVRYGLLCLGLGTLLGVVASYPDWRVR